MKLPVLGSLMASVLVATVASANADNHPNTPAPRPAPQHQAPRVAPPRSVPPASRQLPPKNDMHAPVYHAPITARPGAPVYHPPVYHAPVNTVNHPPANVQPHEFGPPHHDDRIITRPHFSRTPWGWNRNVVWLPAPTYWGGGFWGPFGFGIAYVPLGFFAYDGYDYDSYPVHPGSPGAQLLAAYQLTQTPCGPPNLVVIWGPNNSVICAYPNNLVGPGQYTIDPTTLTLVSSSNS